MAIKLSLSLLIAKLAIATEIVTLSAQAMEPNIDTISNYSSVIEIEEARKLLSLDASVEQFNDVQPTDWAYQALVKLVRKYGCVEGYPKGIFRGTVPITRYEAAALMASCLDRVTEITDELERLINEFEDELNYVAGSIMLLENRIGIVQANQFSTTTKLRGKSTFTTGATNSYGTRKGSEYIWDFDKKHKIVEIDGRESPLGSTKNSHSWQKTKRAWNAVHNSDGTFKEKNGKRGTEIIQGTKLEKHYKDIRSRKFRERKNWKSNGSGGGTSAYNDQYGAYSFNYEQKFNLKTSFTGKDMLYTSLVSGDFCDNAFAGDGVNLAKLSTSPCTDGRISLGRLYYRFPVKNDELIDHSFIFIVGPKGRNTEHLAMWPSAYNRGSARILDWTSLAGSSSVYNKATGTMLGVIYKNKTEYKGDPTFGFSLSYVAENADKSDSALGGMFTKNSKGNLLAQGAWGGDEYGIALGYRYGQCGTNQRRGTEFVAANNFNNECNYDSWAWDPRNGKELYKGSYIHKRSNRDTHNFAINGYWVPLYSDWIPSVSLGYSRSVTNGDGFFDGSPLASNSWFAATKWDDVLYSGNDLGISFGQPNFSTDHPQDSNYLLEIYSSFKVSNNIDITPSIFWLSKPLGSFTANLSGDQNQDGSSKFGVFGGLIQSVFRF